MGKWIKWILVGSALLLIATGGLVAYAVANLDTYLEENRALLEAQAEGAIGRSVRFERIGVSFMGGLGVGNGLLHVGARNGAVIVHVAAAAIAATGTACAVIRTVLAKLR